jgi:hypothetical protein
MYCTTLRLAVRLFTTLLLAAAGARSQDVLVSEVRADDGNRWIELHNRGASAANLSTWSLHYASKTPGQARNYWWPFPVGTVIAPDGYLRVHWFQAGTNVPGAPELWTGTSPYAFLFGLGGETLHGARGAVGLFATQSNSAMSTPAVVVDWVSWGEHDFQREPLAVANGVWATGRHAPAIAPTTSLARDPTTVGTVAFPDLAWFVDNTPTPLAPNVGGAVAAPHGETCTLPGHHLLGQPTLQANALPQLGNPTFALTVANTTGVPGEFALLAFAAAAVQPGTPSILPTVSGVTCQHALDLGQLITTWIAPTQLLGTTMPLSLAGLSPALFGAELHAQALVFDLMPNAWPPFQGTSNGLRLVLGQ